MAKSFGNNVLPTPSSSWSVTGGATITGGQISMPAGSTASITVTRLAENNILPAAIQLVAKANSYGSRYAPKAMVSLHIVYDDKSMYDVTIPVVETAKGKGAVVELSPSVGNYVADLGYYSSLTVKVKALQAVAITAIELRKQEGSALKEDVIYQGIQISSQTGLTVNAKDGRYQATLSSTRFEMKAKKNGSLQSCIYFDTTSGKYKITGDVIIDGLVSITNGLSNGTTTINGGCIKTGKISAARLDLSGVASISSLANGTTTINGGCIKTGTISAARLNLSGAISFGDLNGDVQGRINNSANPDYIHSTYISSTEIRSPTISAGKFLGATFRSSDGGNWIQMGNNGSYAWLNHYSTMYSSSSPICTMGYGVGQYWILAPFGQPNFQFSNISKTWYFRGKVDFSNASVTGL